jgi:toxin-antitoxin system PIN domain toxin
VILLDVNVLVYAYREEAPQHPAYARWLGEAVASDQACGINDVVMSGVVRIVTNPRVFRTPAPIDRALEFADALRAQPTVVKVDPGHRHWSIFTRLCKDVGAKGNLVPDVWLAALAIESGSELISADRDFARFPALKWRHPLGTGAR